MPKQLCALLILISILLAGCSSDSSQGMAISLVDKPCTTTFTYQLTAVLTNNEELRFSADKIDNETFDDVMFEYKGRPLILRMYKESDIYVRLEVISPNE